MSPFLFQLMRYKGKKVSEDAEDLKTQVKRINLTDIHENLIYTDRI